MGDRIAKAPALVGALQADLRFRAAPLELRGVYRMLLDFMDAAGDVAAHGLDGAAAAAAALGCSRDEAAPLLARMESAALLRVEAARVCLLVGSPRGARGGMSAAERVRRTRARAADATVGNGPVTGAVTGEPTVNAGVSTVGSGSVTGSTASDVTGSAPPAAPPPSLSPAPPLPLTPSPPPSPAGGVGRGPSPLPDGAPRQPNLLDLGAPDPKPAKAAPPRALPFTIGEALDALAAPSAGRFVRGEARDIDKKTAVPLVAMVKAYPTLAEWTLVGEWLAAGAMAHCPTLGLTWACSSGLRSAMALARDWSAKGRPPPDAAAPRLAPARAASGPQPAAPRSAFEHATLAGRLGLRWKAPTDGSDRDAAFHAQTGLTVAEARARVAALPTPTSAPATAGASR
ncbi:MAG: hypothetical protein Q8S73_38470 [Deltaproteobacteria bacterium]|nr:hypothetical protein [Myxococcales bacterium]MDP3220049.1 hypothetical protein [Deltaproteobacteria bacterium]